MRPKVFSKETDKSIIPGTSWAAHRFVGTVKSQQLTAAQLMGKEGGADLENNGTVFRGQVFGNRQSHQQSAKLIALVFCVMGFCAKTWF